jgi:hypothetical protein
MLYPQEFDVIVVGGGHAVQTFKFVFGKVSHVIDFQVLCRSANRGFTAIGCRLRINHSGRIAICLSHRIDLG